MDYTERWVPCCPISCYVQPVEVKRAEIGLTNFARSGFEETSPETAVR